MGIAYNYENRSKLKGLKGLKGRPGLLEVKAEPLPTTEDGRSFSHALHVIAEDNYGFAGPRFIAFLKDKGRDAINDDYRKMLMQLDCDDERDDDSKGSDKVSKSRCDDVAVIALADYYASLSVFNIKDEKTAWNEAVNLGQVIMTAM